MLNKSFNFYDNLRKITSETIERTKPQSGILRKAAATLFAGQGQGVLDTTIKYIGSKLFLDFVSSPFYKTVSSKIKSGLAKAIYSGDTKGADTIIKAVKSDAKAVTSTILNKTKKIKPGLSIEDVSKKGNGEIRKTILGKPPLQEGGIKLYKGVGGEAPNINRMAYGSHFADNPKLAGKYGKNIVSETIPKGEKIADLDVIKRYYAKRQVLSDPKQITQDLIDKGYKWGKSTMPDGQFEYVKLEGTKSGWKQAGDWMPGEPIATKGKYAVLDEVKNGEATGKYVLAEENKGAIRKFNSIEDAQNYLNSQPQGITPKKKKKTKTIISK